MICKLNVILDYEICNYNKITQIDYVPMSFWLEQCDTFFLFELPRVHSKLFKLSRVCWHFYEYFQQSRYLAKEIHKDRKKRWCWNDTDTLAPRTHTDCRSAPGGRVSKLLLDVVPWPAAAARCSAQTCDTCACAAADCTRSTTTQRTLTRRPFHIDTIISEMVTALLFSLLNAIWETHQLYIRKYHFLMFSC